MSGVLCAARCREKSARQSPNEELCMESMNSSLHKATASARHFTIMRSYFHLIYLHCRRKSIIATLPTPRSSLQAQSQLTLWRVVKSARNCNANRHDVAIHYAANIESHVS